MNWNDRIRQAFGGSPIDDDILEELAQHATALYASARAEGCGGDEAIRRVDEQVAIWVADSKNLHRRRRQAAAIAAPPGGTRSGLAAVLQDVRYAGRLLARRPAYGALVTATMALGISATTILGSVAYGVLLKPLPWADAPRLVRLYETRSGSTRRMQPMLTNGTFLAWRDTPSATLDGIAAWSQRSFVFSNGGAAQRIPVGGVTASLFGMVGGTPLIGRLFDPRDEQDIRLGPVASTAGRPTPVAMLSYGLWQQEFGGRTDILDQTLRLDGNAYQIVGVMPASFAFPDRRVRAWIPWIIGPMTVPNQDGVSLQMFQAIGRMRPGASPEQVSAEGTARGHSVPTDNPVTMAVFGSTGGVEVTAVPVLKALTGDVRPAILILLAAVVLLLVTATANVASLQLARATGRRRELAIRASLGAGRGRLVRQTLVENLVLGLLGGLAGVALGAAIHRALPSLLPRDFPRLDDLAFDGWIQAFAIAVSLAAGLGCGLLPALHAARADVASALAEDSLAPVGGGVRTRIARARALIMAGQVAIACVLLVGALLLIRSFTGLLAADIGYHAENVLTARLVLPNGEYNPARRQQTIDTIVDRLGAVAGVERTAFANTIPFSGGESLSAFPLKKRDGSSVQVQTGSRVVSPGYFAAIGQRIAEGRAFSATDTAQGARIVNREFARRYLDNRALGWTIFCEEKANQEIVYCPIVGVVDDTARQAVTDSPQPEMYSPARQRPMRSTDIHLIVKASADAHALVPALRSIVQTAAPGAPLESIMTMEDRRAESLSTPRLYAVLLGGFSAFALIIAGVGLFGVLSYTVAERSREIGIRSALGARVLDIVGLVVRQSMAIAVPGLVVGVFASFWLTTTLERFLFGIRPHDPVSFAVVAFVLLAVAAIASVVPARRAARVDPVRVLRL